MKDREQAEEERLHRLFEVLNTPLESQDFVSDVMRRVQHPVWMRRLILGGSVALGLYLSASPFVQLVERLMDRLMPLAANWAVSAPILEFQIVAAILLSTLVLPSFLRWMSQ